MRIRVEGTETGIAAVIDRIRPVLRIWEVSRFYQNRGEYPYGRVYLTIDTSTAPEEPASGSVHVPAERADRNSTQHRESERLDGGAARQIRGPA